MPEEQPVMNHTGAVAVVDILRFAGDRVDLGFEEGKN